MAGGSYPTSRGMVDRRRMERMAAPILRQIGLDVPLDQPVEERTLAQRQLVEIAKGLLAHSRVLILDQPNSALQRQESERLSAVIVGWRALTGWPSWTYRTGWRKRRSLADTVTVLRNGKRIASAPVGESSIPEAIETTLASRPSSLRLQLPTPTPPATRRSA